MLIRATEDLHSPNLDDIDSDNGYLRQGIFHSCACELLTQRKKLTKFGVQLTRIFNSNFASAKRFYVPT